MNSRKTINGNGNSRKRTIDEDGEDPLEGFRQREPPARMANEAALPQQQQRASGAAESELVQELVRRLGQNNSGGQPLQLPASLGTSGQNYASSRIAQLAGMQGGSLPLPQGLGVNYLAPSLAPAFSLQQIGGGAAYNPFLLQLLGQSMMGASSGSAITNSVSDQLFASGLLRGGAQRPDPPVIASSNPQALNINALLASLQGNVAAPSASPVPFNSGGGLQRTEAAPAAATEAPPQTRSGIYQAPNRRPGDGTQLLYVSGDEECVNKYQRFARKQIELFEAKQEDVDAGAQGRNKPIILGQVGIRCIHCSELHPRFRSRASVYYPSRLSVLYQAAQNIVNVHLPELCESIPEDVRQYLLHLDTKRSAVGGGKKYWCDSAAAQGVVDTPHGLRYKDNPLPLSSQD